MFQVLAYGWSTILLPLDLKEQTPHYPKSQIFHNNSEVYSIINFG